MIFFFHRCSRFFLIFCRKQNFPIVGWWRSRWSDFSENLEGAAVTRGINSHNFDWKRLFRSFDLDEASETDIPRSVYWFASSVIMWWFGWFWLLFSGWCVNFSIDADVWIVNRVFNYKSWISAQCLCLLRFWQCFIHSRRCVSRLKTLLLVQYGEYVLNRLEVLWLMFLKVVQKSVLFF